MGKRRREVRILGKRKRRTREMAMSKKARMGSAIM